MTHHFSVSFDECRHPMCEPLTCRVHRDVWWLSSQRWPREDGRSNVCILGCRLHEGDCERLTSLLELLEPTFTLFTIRRSLSFAAVQVDGCGNNSYYDQGYRTMGQALQNSGRDIVYSCSWPAYLGDDETTKPFAEMISDGCNLWCALACTRIRSCLCFYCCCYSC